MVTIRKKRLYSVMLLVCCIIAPVYVQEQAASQRGATVVDPLNILTQEEHSRISGLLDAFSSRAQTDSVAVITANTGAKTPQEYADDYFDYNGYGIGSEHEGILLLLVVGDSSQDRSVHISTCGSATIAAVSDSGIDDLLDSFIEAALESGSYAHALEAYINTLNGIFFNTLSIQECLVACLAGIILTIALYWGIKGRYSLKKNEQWYDIAKNTRTHFDTKTDVLLGSYTTSVKRPKSSSSGGSSTHTSSSGRTHGGGGRSF